jgi:hypothetical protein
VKAAGDKVNNNDFHNAPYPRNNSFREGTNGHVAMIQQKAYTHCSIHHSDKNSKWRVSEV